MRVLVFEPDHRGHRLQYVASLAEALAKLPVETTLVIDSDALSSPEGRAHLIAPAGRPALRIETVSPLSGGSLRTTVQRTLALGRAILRYRPDHVYVPYADGLAQLAAVYHPLKQLRRGTEVEGLMLRTLYDNRRTATVRLHARALEHSLVKWFHWLDPRSVDRLRADGSPLGQRSTVIPEPVEPFAPIRPREARKRLGLPTDGFVFGLLGSMTPRKGVEPLLAAFANAGLPAECHLLLYGGMGPDTLALLHQYRELQLSGRLLWRNEYLAQDDFWLGIAACDRLVLPYLGHTSSSGVLVRAVSAGRRVIGTREGWIGRTIDQFAIGSVCDVRDVHAFGEALRAERTRENASMGEAAQRFARFHTKANHQAHFLRRLRLRLGLPHAECVDWEATCAPHSSGVRRDGT